MTVVGEGGGCWGEGGVVKEGLAYEPVCMCYCLTVLIRVIVIGCKNRVDYHER